MVTIPEQLKKVADAVENGEEPTATVREFLSWFGHERRGSHVVFKIRQALSETNLATKPDFEYRWLDGQIQFVKKPEPSPTTTTTTTPAPETSTLSTAEPDAVTVVGGAVEDPTYRIGKLEAANRSPRSVRPDAPLSEAVTIMLREDYSQLPVMTSERDVKGVVSWKSIAARLALAGPCSFVRECMDTRVQIAEEETSLFRVIELIVDQGFVLVQNSERKIGGIITATDLSESFYQLGRPFLLLSEIENHIRGMIDGKFSKSELEEVRNPDDSDREINDVSDLTFGEYVRLLQKPERWEKLGLAIDRTTFIKDLERVNGIRNDVMHFDPDGITDDDLEELRKTAKFLQDLRDVIRS